jgi:pimeloyl-ACP methyl ester carboxylesterase
MFPFARLIAALRTWVVHEWVITAALFANILLISQAQGQMLGATPTAAARAPVSVGGERPQVFSAELIGTYSQERLSQIAQVDLQAFLTGSTMSYEQFKGSFAAPANGLKLYRLRYPSVVPEMGNRSVMASGLVAIPETLATDLPVISYQHGTVFEKDSVPSRPEQSIETRLILSQFGGQGYVVIAADYFGLGDSELPNAFWQRDSIERSTFDLYVAAMKFIEQQGKRSRALATVGWSQGGYNTMILLRKLEREGIRVAASLTAAAAVDVGLFVMRNLTNPRSFEASYRAAGLSSILFAMESYRGFSGLARDALRPEYFSTAKALFDFKISFDAFMKRVPTDPRDMMRPEFIEQMVLGRGAFFQALDEAASYRWLSRTPLRAYSGERDEVVPDFMARLAVDYQWVLGKRNGEAFSAGAHADHRATYAYSLIHAKQWMDERTK